MATATAPLSAGGMSGMASPSGTRRPSGGRAPGAPEPRSLGPPRPGRQSASGPPRGDAPGHLPYEVGRSPAEPTNLRRTGGAARFRYPDPRRRSAGRRSPQHAGPAVAACATPTADRWAGPARPVEQRDRRSRPGRAAWHRAIGLPDTDRDGVRRRPGRAHEPDLRRPDLGAGTGPFPGRHRAAPGAERTRRPPQRDQRPHSPGVAAAPGHAHSHRPTRSATCPRWTGSSSSTWASRRTPISDLTPLAGTTTLNALGVAGAQVTDIGPLAGHDALRHPAISAGTRSPTSPRWPGWPASTPSTWRRTGSPTPPLWRRSPRC